MTRGLHVRMYENIRVPPSPWKLILLSPGSLNRLKISYGCFFVGGGGGVQYVSVNRFGHVETVSVHLTSDPGI